MRNLSGSLPDAYPDGTIKEAALRSLFAELIIGAGGLVIEFVAGNRAYVGLSNGGALACKDFVAFIGAERVGAAGYYDG